MEITVQRKRTLPFLWARWRLVFHPLAHAADTRARYGDLLIVEAERDSLAVALSPEGARQVVHLWVKDNGIGINIEDQAKIFQKFFRSDDSKAREAPGTGLGLNITKRLVEMQGGKIWFESDFRQGTTFHFTIPVAEG